MGQVIIDARVDNTELNRILSARRIDQDEAIIDALLIYVAGCEYSLDGNSIYWECNNTGHRVSFFKADRMILSPRPVRVQLSEETVQAVESHANFRSETIPLAAAIGVSALAQGLELSRSHILRFTRSVPGLSRRQRLMEEGTIKSNIFNNHLQAVLTTR